LFVILIHKSALNEMISLNVEYIQLL